MRGRLRLTHLTLLGASKATAQVAFESGLNVVSGPSDTGKSFIVDAIDFMLGANSMKEVPELEGYNTVLLGLANDLDETFTLERSTSGGSFLLHREDVRSRVEAPNVERLAAKHSAKNPNSVSGFLLGQLGLENRRVRTNARADTRSLSFRDLAHLVIVDETQMQSETPPAVTGNYVQRTAEISVLRMLLQDEDDSHLVADPNTPDARRSTTAQVELLDRLLADLEAQLHDVSEEAALRAQLARLASTVEEFSASTGQLLALRGEQNAQAAALQEDRARLVNELGEARALAARFQLLSAQYDSDVARLETIAEAGTLLGYFDVGVCPFCGAEPDHQHPPVEQVEGVTEFGAAVDAERTKTLLLREDLESTIAEVQRRAVRVEELLGSVEAAESNLRRSLAAIDVSLRPQQADLNELVAARSGVERSLGLYEQFGSMAKMRASLLDSAATETRQAASDIGLGTLRTFSAAIASHLATWGYPGAASTRYDRGEQDMVAGDQVRAAHGKGVRAVLHAAFTLGLADYCIERELAHPGFVVLDSPLVTYRAPDSREARGEVLPAEFAQLFYASLTDETDCQVIVFENIEPRGERVQPLHHIEFSKSTAGGRYGFFPDTTATTSGGS